MNEFIEGFDPKDYEMDAFETIKGVGVLEAVEFGTPKEDTGNRLVTVTISYPENSPDATLYTSSFYFHPTRMRKGADNSDLTEGQQTSIQINKRKFNGLLEASGPTFEKGSRIGFTLGPRSDDPSRPEWKTFYKPKR